MVGFDDIQSAAYSTPSLTTVRQPLLEMGKRGAQVLLERIADREKPFPRRLSWRRNWLCVSLPGSAGICTSGEKMISLLYYQRSAPCVLWLTFRAEDLELL